MIQKYILLSSICYIYLALSILSTESINSKYPVVIFQAVDQSFLSLWINWWAVALKVNAIPTHWEVHIACIGDQTLHSIVSRFHVEGCSQLFPKEIHKKRIYFTKWTAITNALRKGKDLLVIDLDAILIRDPRQVLRIYNDESSQYDVVSSRDHGPAELPFSNLWSGGRFCTGFIFFKYSRKVLELVQFSLNRCDKYGHDQIQFNNALSRSGLAWKENPQLLEKDQSYHESYMAWVHQQDPDFSLFTTSADNKFYSNYQLYTKTIDNLLDNKPLPIPNVLNKAIKYPFVSNRESMMSQRRLFDSTEPNKVDLNSLNSSKSNTRGGMRDKVRSRLKDRVKDIGTEWTSKIIVTPQRPVEKISLLLLDRWSVLRYCNTAQKRHSNWISFLDIEEMSEVEIQSIVALHCFVETGPLGEQGARKKKVKADVMDALNYWILIDHFKSIFNSETNFRIPGYTGEIGLLTNRSAPSTIAFLNRSIDLISYERMKSVWIHGNLSAHVNPIISQSLEFEKLIEKRSMSTIRDTSVA